VVVEALSTNGCFVPSSLDKPVGTGESSTPLGELLGVDDGAQGQAEARVILQPVVRKLSDRDRRILSMRFVEGLTQREIAKRIGVTQMQVSRLLTRIYCDLQPSSGNSSAIRSSPPNRVRRPMRSALEVLARNRYANR
jgi:RNA polymerase sigma-B factor